MVGGQERVYIVFEMMGTVQEIVKWPVTPKGLKRYANTTAQNPSIPCRCGISQTTMECLELDAFQDLCYSGHPCESEVTMMGIHRIIVGNLWPGRTQNTIIEPINSKPPKWTQIRTEFSTMHTKIHMRRFPSYLHCRVSTFGAVILHSNLSSM